MNQYHVLQEIHDEHDEFKTNRIKKIIHKMSGTSNEIHPWMYWMSCEMKWNVWISSSVKHLYTSLIKLMRSRTALKWKSHIIWFSNTRTFHLSTSFHARSYYFLYVLHRDPWVLQIYTLTCAIVNTEWISNVMLMIINTLVRYDTEIILLIGCLISNYSSLFSSDEAFLCLKVSYF